MIMGLEW